MKVLLISPKCSSRIPSVYNVGLAYVGAALRADGHEVDLVDFNTRILSQADMLAAIRKKGRPDAFAMGTLITSFKHVAWLIDELKSLYPEIPVWVGNSIASTIPSLFLNNTKADVAVLGEGEITVKELASGKSWDQINGLFFKRNGEVFETPARNPIADLDTLPLPAYDLFDQDIYMKGYAYGRRTMCLGVSSRGCPYRCTYCYHAFQGVRTRHHSADRMMAELEFALGKYDFDYFYWADDLFIANRKKIMEFCELMKKSRVKKNWSCSARVNLVDEELLIQMKSAGCTLLSFGVESGSQKILDNIKKGVKVEQAKKAIDLCSKIGIPFNYSLMIGNVGENRETVMETVRFTEETDTFCPALFIATPYPQTELYEYGIKTGKIKDELRLIRSYGEQAATLLVNFSDVSDRELLDLKNEAEASIKRTYYKKHPLARLKDYYVLIQILQQYFQYHGFTGTALRVVQAVVRKATGNPLFELSVLKGK